MARWESGNRVESSLDGSGWELVADMSAGSGGYIIDDLQLSTAYQFRVTPLDENGTPAGAPLVFGPITTTAEDTRGWYKVSVLANEGDPATGQLVLRKGTASYTTEVVGSDPLRIDNNGWIYAGSAEGAVLTALKGQLHVVNTNMTYTAGADATGKLVDPAFKYHPHIPIGSDKSAAVGLEDLTYRTWNDKDYDDAYARLEVAWTVPPVVSVTASSPNAIENEETDGRFLISRTGSTAGPLAVNFRLQGTADAETDYIVDPVAVPLDDGYVVVIPAGEPSIEIAITPILDEVDEDEETAELLLTPEPETSELPDYLVGADAAMVTITDVPTVSVEATDDVAIESRADDVLVFTATRTGACAESLTVPFYFDTSAEDSATPGEDFTLTGSPQFVFAAAESTATVALHVVPDTEEEAQEAVLLVLGPATSAWRPATTQSSAEGNIGDTSVITIRSPYNQEDESDPKRSLRIGHWGSAQDQADLIRPYRELSGYDGSGHIHNKAQGTFVDTDPDRFIVVVDDDATHQAGTNTIEVSVSTVDATGKVEDDPTPIELAYNAALKRFVSEPQLLTAPDYLDKNNTNVGDDKLAVYSFRSSAPVQDDQKNDRTHWTALGGRTIATYGGRKVSCTVGLPRSDALQPGPDEILDLKIRVHVLNEPPGVDINGNGVRDTVLGSQQAAGDYIAGSIARANIAWAQGGIRVVQQGAVIFDDAPLDAQQRNVIADSRFDLNDNNPGADERALVQSVMNSPNQGGTSATVVEVYFVPRLRIVGAPDAFAWGKTLIAKMLPFDRTFCFIGLNPEVREAQRPSPLSCRTLAHELGHAMTNSLKGDAEFDAPRYVFFPQRYDRLHSPDDSFWTSDRRIVPYTEAQARLARQVEKNKIAGNPFW